MNHKTRWIVVGVCAAALVGCGTTIAIASASDDDAALTGPSLDKASTAALAATHGGTVVETEVGDDGAAYGVEVKRTDGSTVEVSLDADFNVINQQVDDDGAADQDTSDD
ncbi:MAG: hypothetical protein ABI586_09395 [Candidatus Nanopelagicales bacterium]